MPIELVSGVALAAVLLLVFLLRRYGCLPSWPLLVLVVALLFALMRFWSWGGTGNNPEKLVRAVGKSPSGNSETLIVLVHGLGGPTDLTEVRDDLAELPPTEAAILASRGIKSPQAAPAAEHSRWQQKRLCLPHVRRSVQ